MSSDPHRQDEKTPEQRGWPFEREGGSDGPEVTPPAGAGRDPAAAEAGQHDRSDAEDSSMDGSDSDEASSANDGEKSEEAGREGSMAERPPAKSIEERQAEAAQSGAGGPAEGSETDEAEEGAEATKRWYIVKVQVNREDSIRRALERRIKVAGLDDYFGDIVVPTEDVAEFNKSGKRRIVKKKLYPGYIMVNLVLNDDTWFLVRETPGIGDFTGSAGKPTPMEPHEVERIVRTARTEEGGEASVKTSIPFKPGDRVRVKEGYFQNFEGDVETIDDANGRVTVMINIFGRSTPVELEHWQVESV